MKHHIFVTVQGGVAEVCEDTAPAGVLVEILDFDNFAVDPDRELSMWSPELRAYWLANHAKWGRCHKQCACPVMRRLQNEHYGGSRNRSRAGADQRPKTRAD